MKKIIFAISMITFNCMLGFSQLKVKSDGTLRMASSTPVTSKLMVHIGDTAANVLASTKYGLYSSVRDEFNYRGVAVKGEAHPSNENIYVPVGVWGEAGDGTFNSFGVVGHVTGSSYGAGIFGMTGEFTSPSLYTAGAQYAGYFRGETRVEGDFTATNVYTSSDIRLKENIKDISEGDSDNAIDKIAKLNVIKYNLKNLFTDSTSTKQEVERNTNTTPLLHFGVSAQELQTIYPNLVKEGQDGFLSVNYIELVPVLIRCVQELKQELDMVNGNGENVNKTRSACDKENKLENFEEVKRNVLYQNTPNPFKEQTTIRFRLADDVRDAAICIFDMSGKMLKKLPISSSATSVSVNGWELGEGMFLYTLLINGQEIDTKKMIFTK